MQRYFALFHSTQSADNKTHKAQSTTKIDINPFVILFARLTRLICVFISCFILLATNANAMPTQSTHILTPSKTKSTQITKHISQNQDSTKPKPFSLEPDSLVITPDSRLKSQNPPLDNPASAIINPKKALRERNQASRELLDSNVIPQYLPRAKLPAPLLPPPALTPYSVLESQELLQKREFIISYKALSQNGIITGEKYNISSPLISKSSLPIEYTCSIDTPINDLITDDEDYAIEYVLHFYQDEILHCLRYGGASVLSYAKSANATHISDDTVLSVPAKRVLAYFDNRYLILEILKELK